MAVIGINYNESDVNTYKSVYLFTIKGTKINFYTGNFVKDWFNAKKYWLDNFRETDPHFSQSSSVNHFIMDGGNLLYDSTYLKFDKNEEPYLDYDFWANGWEFFVPKEKKWAWKELKQYCKE